MLFTENKYIGIILVILFLPFTIIYWMVVTVRHFFYDIGILKPYTADIFTVSVGNITAGGTGKTPTVIAIVNALKNNGFKPFVVTRGYGRKSSGRLMIDEKSTASESGDEPITIFRKTGVPVVCDKDRLSAVNSFGNGFNIAVLDDAFQHRKIRKNLDIVLIDESRFLGCGLLLPSGILRDNVSRLYKCDLIVLSKVNDIRSVSVKEKITRLKKYGKNILVSKMEPSKISNGTKEATFDSIKDKKISLFCGIADARSFLDLFRQNQVISKITFSDHYFYTVSDFEALRKLKKDSDMIITTYKDFVKLPPELVRETGIYYLDIDLSFYDSELNSLDIAGFIRGFFERAE
ncbi:MAG TPA: tetraacyldisaccharide 4'-kinase [Clostridiales bacterium]|jgi:tetraacyldisaccharide 4'-kinase|nr:tetraacyldisaccharide 4'-kinase [Clostridiales bacterium]HQP69829.1 tetraacyldisaccharide 4'-kinase [Clostridiales bacterium]